MTVYDFSTFEVNRSTEEHSPRRRQVIAFLGDGLEFPNHSLEVIGAELPGVDILRLETLDQVRDVTRRICVETTLLVIAEGRRDDVIARYERYSEAAKGSRLVFAYETECNARHVYQSEIGSAVSFLPMRCRIDAWVAYIRLFCSGETIVPRDLLESNPGKRMPVQAGEDEADDAEIQLTRRENEVLGLVAKGFGNRQIASTIGISEHTVKLHLHNVFAKLEVSNRAGAVARYLRRER